MVCVNCFLELIHICVVNAKLHIVSCNMSVGNYIALHGLLKATYITKKIKHIKWVYVFYGRTN